MVRNLLRAESILCLVSSGAAQGSLLVSCFCLRVKYQSTASELVWGVEQADEGWKQDVFVGQAAPHQPFLCICVSVAP